MSQVRLDTSMSDRHPVQAAKAGCSMQLVRQDHGQLQVSLYHAAAGTEQLGLGTFFSYRLHG